MNLLDRLEAALQATFEGAFERGFASKLHPLEIAEKLREALERERRLSVGQTYVPNDYLVRVSEADLEALRPLRDEVCAELSNYLQQFAAAKGYVAQGGPQVVLSGDPRLRPGQVAVQATFAEVRPVCRLRIRGQDGPWREEAFHGPTVTIGRDRGCDVVLNDTKVSRHHAELTLDSSGWVLRDLGSRNGTEVNGSPITEAHLRDGDHIRLGMTDIHFSCTLER
jgi:hypothetical protein